MSALDHFSEATRTWFGAAFAAPTPAQEGAWEAIGAGRNALVVAPTGSGKTLSAFLWSIDRLLTEPRPDDKQKRCRVLYISPLKALAVDVERNLRAPLTGIRHTAERLGDAMPEVRVGVRSGDTPPAERRALTANPPDVLITTPESLFLTCRWMKNFVSSLPRPASGQRVRRHDEGQQREGVAPPRHMRLPPRSPWPTPVVERRHNSSLLVP